MNEIKDCRGVVVSAGDTIVYPGRKGSALWLNMGVVQAPRVDGQLTLNVQKSNGKMVELFETSRIAVVAHASV